MEDKCLGVQWEKRFRTSECFLHNFSFISPLSISFYIITLLSYLWSDQLILVVLEIRKPAGNVSFYLILALNPLPLHSPPPPPTVFCHLGSIKKTFHYLPYIFENGVALFSSNVFFLNNSVYFFKNISSL